MSVKSCDITLRVFSYHEFVFVTLELGDPPRQGPGMWKLNNYLLEDQSYCKRIHSLIDSFLPFEHAFASSSTFWESLKWDIKSASIAFSRQKQRDLSRQRVSITNRLVVLKNRLVPGDLSVRLQIFYLEGSLKTLMTEENENANHPRPGGPKGASRLGLLAKIGQLIRRFLRFGYFYDFC